MAPKKQEEGIVLFMGETRNFLESGTWKEYTQWTLCETCSYLYIVIINVSSVGVIKVHNILQKCLLCTCYEFSVYSANSLHGA